jgi:sugar O-acyltransferase (sialic acid O-acetyltransferase NeuD family)
MKKSNTYLRDVILIGAGGHARVLLDSLIQDGIKIKGYTSIESTDLLKGFPHLGNDDAVLRYDPDSVDLVNGIGSIPKKNKARKGVEKYFGGRGYSFRSVVHQSAVISCETEIARGAQIMAGVVIQNGSIIGANSIINTSASIDHDCKIGEDCHIAPGCTLSGGVRVGSGTHLGTGATVIQGVLIGENCTIAAGSVIHFDVPDNSTIIQKRTM